MEFKEAYDHLVQEKRIKRRGWEDKTVFMSLDSALDVKCYRQACVVFSYDLSVFDEDWFIVGEKENLCFSQAIDHLLKGKKIKLESWPDDCFVEADKSKQCLIKRVNCEYDFIPSFQCLAADDWEVIEEGET